MCRLTVRVLGSAAGGGFPQWNCRSQAGIALCGGDGPWTLINASPYLGQQIRANPALHPRGLRASPIEAVVLTGAEIDQIAGLACLREGTPFALYATPATHAAVAANAMFDALTLVARRAVAPGARMALPGGLSACLFAVPGKRPLYMEGEYPASDLESTVNVGIEIERQGARVVFVPGAAAITPAMRSGM